MAAPKALETIGKALHAQYERWQPRVKPKLTFGAVVLHIVFTIGCRYDL